MSEPEQRLVRLIEAVLFAAAEPVPEQVLSRRLPEGTELEPILALLKAQYAERGVNLVRAGSAWVFRTAPDLAAMLAREVELPRKLGRATLETLAIIAYHQPVTRAEIEEVRGVSLGRTPFDVLLQAGWIRPRGRRRSPGRPLTWGTTDAFLLHFGLETLEDLPGVEELKAAGLLDARPAVEAYGELALDTADGEVGPGTPEPAEEDMGLEPLDPDDDVELAKT